MDEIEKAYLEEVRRNERRDFVRLVSIALEDIPPRAFPLQQQADTLRKMADQLDREAEGNPVQRSQERVSEREAWPNRAFFQKTPAQPSPEMRDRWLADAQERATAAQPEKRDFSKLKPAVPSTSPDPQKPTRRPTR